MRVRRTSLSPRQSGPCGPERGSFRRTGGRWPNGRRRGRRRRNDPARDDREVLGGVAVGRVLAVDVHHEPGDGVRAITGGDQVKVIGQFEATELR